MEKENTVLSVACLGPEGSYSQLAAQKLCAGYRVFLCRNFQEVVRALVTKRTDRAVLPVENAIQGGVLQSLDLLERSEVFGIAEAVLPIDHRLVTREGVDLKDVELIYSHEQAIGQCSEYLDSRFPKARRIFTQSTAECLSYLDEHSAGIVGSHVVGEGLVLSGDNIANEKHNFTRFMLLQRAEDPRPVHSGMVFFCAVCAHRPGTLLSLLQVFARSGLNLTRIESRPIRESFGEYRFFIEFSGDLYDEKVRGALAEAGRECKQFKLIGAYR